ncbi:G-protein-signaling modulator 2-like [Montipora capricornis]|uniref:G-protein-signaling modulator 2-like n=1 Tax=Montipora foliosa TaxID=591990 RepID=UPI0035F1AB0C
MSKTDVEEYNLILKPPIDEGFAPFDEEKPLPLEKRLSVEMNSVEQHGSLNEQVKHLERKIRAYSKAKDKVNEGEALSSLGILYYKASKFFDARSCHERHLNIAKSLRNKRAEKRAYCNLGCTYRRIGDLDRAVECYEEGLALVKELNDKLGQAKLLNNLGNIYEQRSDFDKAVYYHQRRLDVAKELKDLDGESKACASLGNIYHLLGNIRESINYYEKLVACLKYKLAAQEKKGKNEASAENGSSPVSSFTKSNDDKGHKWALKGPGDDRDERSSIRRKNSGRSNSTESKGSTA